MYDNTVLTTSCTQISLLLVILCSLSVKFDTVSYFFVASLHDRDSLSLQLKILTFVSCLVLLVSVVLLIVNVCDRIPFIS